MDAYTYLYILYNTIFSGQEEYINGGKASAKIDLVNFEIMPMLLAALLSNPISSLTNTHTHINTKYSSRVDFECL